MPEPTEEDTAVLMCVRADRELVHTDDSVLEVCADCGVGVWRANNVGDKLPATGPGGMEFSAIPENAIVCCGWCTVTRAEKAGDPNVDMLRTLVNSVEGPREIRPAFMLVMTVAQIEKARAVVKTVESLGIKQIPVKCADCGVDCVKADAPIAASGLFDDNPRIIAARPDLDTVCCLCGAARCDEVGDWEHAAYYRRLNDIQEQGFPE